MPLEKTYQELLASKINPRNPSAVLPVIYNLRKKSFEPYVPTATNRIIFSPGVVGDGATAVFDVISPTSYTRSQTITLSGTATYILTDGTTSYTKAATSIVAQIDVGITNENRNLIGYQQRVLASEIGDNGVFSFTISSEIMEKLSIGTHYVYIDAASPDNAPVRLSASSTPSNPTDPLYYTRTFTITA
jgi:hypothetical protein